MHRILHLREFTFQMFMKYPKVDHILGHKTNLKNLIIKKLKTQKDIFSDGNDVQL